jgi:LysM repeat protein
MKDDTGFQADDETTADGGYRSKRGRAESSTGRLLPAFLIVLLAVVLVLGISYFLTKRPAGGDTAVLSKMTALEEKIASLEKQMGELQSKSGASGPDPSLAQRVDLLSQKVATLEKQRFPAPEKQKAAAMEPKGKPVPPKAAVTAEKRYHTVQKGETLYKISKKYGIRVEELRKLNNLSGNQSIKTGQKLLVSTE